MVSKKTGAPVFFCRAPAFKAAPGRPLKGARSVVRCRGWTSSSNERARGEGLVNVVVRTRSLVIFLLFFGHVAPDTDDVSTSRAPNTPTCYLSLPLKMHTHPGRSCGPRAKSRHTTLPQVLYISIYRHSFVIILRRKVVSPSLACTLFFTLLAHPKGQSPWSHTEP